MSWTINSTRKSTTCREISAQQRNQPHVVNYQLNTEINHVSWNINSIRKSTTCREISTQHGNQPCVMKYQLNTEVNHVSWTINSTWKSTNLQLLTQVRIQDLCRERGGQEKFCRHRAAVMMTRKNWGSFWLCDGYVFTVVCLSIFHSVLKAGFFLVTSKCSPSSDRIFNGIIPPLLYIEYWMGSTPYPPPPTPHPHPSPSLELRQRVVGNRYSNFVVLDFDFERINSPKLIRSPYSFCKLIVSFPMSVN